ncbi:MAG: hypothetical protein HXO31_09575 [Prevotella sp.]|jgi:hypothetical protein|uniref:hypothetical protein n=1 Tax=Prevotella sp. TaxID=59823 RepID=UPI001CB4C02F|nr:hypothetical protein [Prevotella sp.]MBF1582861.1 hypothetical protein [Prevotella sp.]MBF1600013.1 hypothetical protein [Prevotella sp.]
MDTTSLTKRLKIEIDGWPSLGGNEISKEDIRNTKERLGPKEEIIKAFGLNLFSFSVSLLFTNYAIYIKDIQNKTEDIIRWWEITKVSYENEHFMFFNSEGKNFKNINVRTFFPKEISIYTGVGFSGDLTSVASIAPNPLQLAQENKYSEAIEAVNYYITIESSIELYVTRAFIYYDKAIKSNDNKNLLQEALTEIEKTIDYCKDHEECWKLHKYKGHLLELMGKITDSRNAYMKSLAEAPEEQKYELQNRTTKLEEANADLWDNYILRVPYKERKYIMLVEDSKIKNCAVSGITIFNSSNVPNCINFYDNMPLNNELYVGHPYNPSVYIPYNQAEDILFQDKIQEFCYILQQLGAEEITITSLKGRKINETNNKKEEVEVAANAGRFGNASLNIDSSTSNLMDRTSHEQYDVKYVYDPIDMPKVPSETIWYQNQPKWQRIVQSRIDGNTLEWTECISSKLKFFTSSSEKEDIKAKLKVLMANIEGRSYKEEEKQLKEETETIWRVSVKFRSKKLLQEKSQSRNTISSTLTDTEKEFLNEVRFCIEDDGVIDNSEQIFLNKTREKFGLTEERAKELQESLLKPQFTENEKEYINALSELMIDGQIPESAQRIVERFRNLYEIDEQRANEIEKKYAHGL